MAMAFSKGALCGADFHLLNCVFSWTERQTWLSSLSLWKDGRNGGKFDQQGAVSRREDENMVNDENEPSINVNDNNEVAPC